MSISNFCDVSIIPFSKDFERQNPVFADKNYRRTFQYELLIDLQNLKLYNADRRK